VQDDILIDYQYPEHPAIDDEIEAHLEMTLADSGNM
jgi:hypothetical protein